jgi:hypothetical protein
MLTAVGQCQLGLVVLAPGRAGEQPESTESVLALRASPRNATEVAPWESRRAINGALT